jgi:hypothetical protein
LARCSPTTCHTVVHDSVTAPCRTPFTLFSFAVPAAAAATIQVTVRDGARVIPSRGRARASASRHSQSTAAPRGARCPTRFSFSRLYLFKRNKARARSRPPLRAFCSERSELLKKAGQRRWRAGNVPKRTNLRRLTCEEWRCAGPAKSACLWGRGHLSVVARSQPVRDVPSRRYPHPRRGPKTTWPGASSVRSPATMSWPLRRSERPQRWYATERLPL